jgi:hypothetical protein
VTGPHRLVASSRPALQEAHPDKPEAEGRGEKEPRLPPTELLGRLDELPHVLVAQDAGQLPDLIGRGVDVAREGGRILLADLLSRLMERFSQHTQAAGDAVLLRGYLLSSLGAGLGDELPGLLLDLRHRHRR